MAFTIPDPIIKPYCNTGSQTPPPLNTSTTVANQETGFPPLMATPLNAGGLPLDIEQFNGIFKYYTKQLFAIVNGAVYTFNQDVSDQNGGYPLGVILYCASNKSWQRSLVNNNTFNFVTNPSYVDDNIHWVSDQFIYILTSDNIKLKGSLDFVGNTFTTTFQNSPSISQNVNYILPPAAPVTDNLYYRSFPSGVTFWDYLYSTYMIANGNGSAPSAGKLGYYLKSSSKAATRIDTGTTPFVNYLSITLPIGNFILTLNATLVGGSSTSNDQLSFNVGISTDSSTNFSDQNIPVNSIDSSFVILSGIGSTVNVSIPSYPVYLSASTTFYFKVGLYFNPHSNVVTMGSGIITAQQFC